MSIEEVILSSSAEPKAKLFGPATKALSNPETGITVVKQGALRVIKDCAETTVNFLPIEIFLSYIDPVKSLKGKFNTNNVTDLFNKSKTNKVSKLLFDLILSTCSPVSVPAQSVLSHSDENDPYGDYDNAVPVTTSTLNSIQVILQTYS